MHAILEDGCPAIAKYYNNPRRAAFFFPQRYDITARDRVRLSYDSELESSLEFMH